MGGSIATPADDAGRDEESTVNIDWNNDEAVVRAAVPSAVAQSEYGVWQIACTRVSEIETWGVWMPMTPLGFLTAKDAWESARKHPTVVAFEQANRATQEASPEDTHDLCRHCGCAKTIQTQLATCPVRSGGLRHEWGPNRPHIWPTPVAVFSDGPLPAPPPFDTTKLLEMCKGLYRPTPDQHFDIFRRLLYLEERVEAAGDGLTIGAHDRWFALTYPASLIHPHQWTQRIADSRAAWMACAERKL